MSISTGKYASSLLPVPVSSWKQCPTLSPPHLVTTKRSSSLFAVPLSTLRRHPSDSLYLFAPCVCLVVKPLAAQQTTKTRRTRSCSTASAPFQGWNGLSPTRSRENSPARQTSVLRTSRSTSTPNRPVRRGPPEPVPPPSTSRTDRVPAVPARMGNSSRFQPPNEPRRHEGREATPPHLPLSKGGTGCPQHVHAKTRPRIRQRLGDKPLHLFSQPSSRTGTAGSRSLHHPLPGRTASPRSLPAGQFLAIPAAQRTTKTRRTRSYSTASAPFQGWNGLSPTRSRVKPPAHQTSVLGDKPLHLFSQPSCRTGTAGAGPSII
jgi:hypothetical protein